MEYCRSLKFEQEPNYKQCIGLFENCLSRHNYDAKMFDYTWKQNRLSKDKENLKAQMLGVLGKKKPAEKEKAKQETSYGQTNAGHAGTAMGNTAVKAREQRGSELKNSAQQMLRK